MSCGRAGWDVTVLEARDRIGGRVWTVRGGDRIVQTGRPDQLCHFSDGLYLNAGAARIPHHHHAILGYARRLGVPMEVMVNSNRAARSEFGGRVYTNRQLTYDTRGRFSELLAKAIDRGALDRRAERRREGGDAPVPQLSTAASARAAPTRRTAARAMRSAAGRLSRDRAAGRAALPPPT